MGVTWENQRLCIRTRSLPPIAIHWSTALGAIIFGRGTLGGALGFAALILIHEIGHALVVRARGLHALEIVIHAFGGGCHYEPGWGTPFDHALIAWGGVAAQAVALVLALVVGRTLDPGRGALADFLFMLVVPSALMIVLNLLPIRGLDGQLAWQLPPMLAARARRRRLEGRRERLRREIETLERRRNLH